LNTHRHEVLWKINLIASQIKNLYEKVNILFTWHFFVDVAHNKSFCTRQKSNSAATTTPTDILRSPSPKAITAARAST